MSFHFRLRYLATTLLVSSVVSASAGDASPPDDPSAPLPYLQPSPDDGWIVRYLRDPRRAGLSFVAGFDSDAAGCFREPRGLAMFDVFLRRHGMSFVFNPPDKGGPHLQTFALPDGSDDVGLISFPDCTVRVDIQKRVMREGTWRAANVTTAADIHDWDEREMRYGSDWRSLQAPPGVMRFLFAADGDECGTGNGMAVLRAHSLVADLSSRSGLRIVRQPGSPFSNDDAFEKATCRYETSILLSAKDTAGERRPVPVSKLFAISAPAPAPRMELFRTPSRREIGRVWCGRRECRRRRTAPGEPQPRHGGPAVGTPPSPVPSSTMRSCPPATARPPGGRGMMW